MFPEKMLPREILVEQLAERLIENKLTVAVAESCTGGMLAQQFTSLNGSSSWFECGFVTYSNASKIGLLEVEVDVLNKYGAVSSQVAEQMALGVLNQCDADISASITGIAGPGGGSKEKPVGTVYIGTAMKNGAENQTNFQAVSSTHHLFVGDRQSVREQTTAMAIAELINRLEQA